MRTRRSGGGDCDYRRKMSDFPRRGNERVKRDGLERGPYCFALRCDPIELDLKSVEPVRVARPPETRVSRTRIMASSFAFTRST